QEEQNRNSLAIAKQAGNLYDKFIGFVEALEEVGGRLNQTVEAWQLARKRLTSGKGNLISRAEALRKLGVQNTKRLPSSVAVEEDEAVCPEHSKCPTESETHETMIQKTL
ncbi:MAG TPA: DNA recombination protein RmuC, partial [Desulfobacteraceae bacterium]|nr:DNA recombination protein RmuC [Desulfobacteraceae bacterium]